ncbi:MAG: class I SAM-dependent methyltransferase [Dehalococcoidia bacterium]
MVDRGFLGTTPLGTERDDDSYLDFVEGVRVFNAAQVGPVFQQKGAEAIDQYRARTGRQVTSLEEVKQIIEHEPVIATRNRVWRWSQEGIWNGVMDAYKDREPELLAELDRYDRMGPGTVQWDPNFQYPEYFAKVDFHIQPGGYYANPLAGYIYHYGTKVFFTGRNNNDDVQRGLCQLLPDPADGQVRRVLDLACSAGQFATAWKEKYPQAEVWAVDAGAPMVRYAHKRAVDMGLEVHFAQRMAEDTGFPDGYFDIINAFILFHEIPTPIAERVVSEAARMLRPGGIFCVEDFGNRKLGEVPVMSEYSGFIDSTYNGEPYVPDFVHSDFPGLLRRHFREVNLNYSDKSWIPIRVATK